MYFCPILAYLKALTFNISKKVGYFQHILLCVGNKKERKAEAKKKKERKNCPYYTGAENEA